jgi:hypothetical protein
VSDRVYNLVPPSRGVVALCIEESRGGGGGEVVEEFGGCV